MNALDFSLQDRIVSELRSQRRSSLVENISLALIFFAGALFLTFIALWVALFASVYFAATFGFASSAVIFAPALGMLLFAFLVIARRQQLIEGDYNPPRITFFTNILSEQMLNAIGETGAVLLLSGPRCAVLAWRFTAFSFTILRADLEHLIAPIQIAVEHPRKIRAADLPGISLNDFLSQAAWIEGIIPLYRVPIGFVLTDEFRQKINAPRASFASAPHDPPAPEYFPDAADDELRWALLVMGLPSKATRKQINSAYRQLAKQIHPDLQSDDATLDDREERMKDLNLAYEILRQRM